MLKRLPTKIVLISTALGLVFLSFLWLWQAAPYAYSIPDNFSYEAEIVSEDSFYNAKAKEFDKPLGTLSKFEYETISKQGEVLIIRNIFEAKTPEGLPIFAVERFYGIDPLTGMHVADYGDRDRSGYLFAPRDLKKERFVYWHVNYNTPAVMEYLKEESLFNLHTYVYEAKYSVDQTVNLGHLPGVPTQQGVNNDVHLKLWIEPETGRLIKYEDDTVAYFYDINTGERTRPWNHFRNQYRQSSIQRQVQLAENDKLKARLIQKVIPITLLALAGMSLTVALVSKTDEKTNEQNKA